MLAPSYQYLFWFLSKKVILSGIIKTEFLIHDGGFQDII